MRNQEAQLRVVDQVMQTKRVSPMEVVTNLHETGEALSFLASKLELDDAGQARILRALAEMVHDGAGYFDGYLTQKQTSV